MPTSFINRASEFQGRFIAYVGGSGVFVFSNEVAAKAQQAADMAQQTPIGPFTISTVVSVGGLVVVFGRLAFDVFKYFDQRKKRKRGEIDEQQYLD
jgi:hypothetical protein